MTQALSTITHLPRLHIRGDEVFCNTQDLATYVDKPHNYVCRAVKKAMRMQDEAIKYAAAHGAAVPEGGVFKVEDTPLHNIQNGETYDAYDLDRNATIALIMGFMGPKAMLWKMGYIAAFNAMEDELRRRSAAPVIDLNDPAFLRQTLLGYTEKVLALETTVADQKKEIAVTAPKAAAWEAYKDSEGLYALSDVGRILGTGPQKTIDWMLARGLLFRMGRCSPLRPMERFARKGWFVAKSRVIDGVERIQTYATPRGLAEIAELIGRPLDLFGQIDLRAQPRLFPN